MTSGPTSQCTLCRHWRSPIGTSDPGGPSTCAAFPAGIPDDIWDNRVDHRQPVAGDNGVQWESIGQAFPEWALATGA